MCRSQHIWPSEYTQAGLLVPFVLPHLCVGNQGTRWVHSQKQGFDWGRAGPKLGSGLRVGTGRNHSRSQWSEDSEGWMMQSELGRAGGLSQD